MIHPVIEGKSFLILILFYMEMLKHRFSIVLETKVLFIPYTAMHETKVLDLMSLDWGVFAKYIQNEVLEKRACLNATCIYDSDIHT